MQVSMAEDVEAGALLIADHYGHGVLKFFAEANVQHASIQRTAPHADVVPAWTRERSRSRARQNQVSSSCKFLRSMSGLLCSRKRRTRSISFNGALIAN